MRSVKRSQEKRVELHRDGTWMISYGDMITLLLAFFVLFFSLDPKKVQTSTLIDSLLKKFEELDQKEKLGNAVPKNKETAKDVPPKTSGGLSEQTSNEVTTTNPWGVGKLKAEQLTGSAAEGVPAKQPHDAVVYVNALQAEIRKAGDSMIITFPNVSFFRTGQTELTKDGTAALERFIGVYTPFAGKNILNIVGFADRRPVKTARFGYRDNLELSTLRAVSALRLIEHNGVPLSRMKLMGHGVNEHLLREEQDKVKAEIEELALARKIMLVIEPIGA